MSISINFNITFYTSCNNCVAWARVVQISTLAVRVRCVVCTTSIAVQFHGLVVGDVYSVVCFLLLLALCTSSNHSSYDCSPEMCRMEPVVEWCVVRLFERHCWYSFLLSWPQSLSEFELIVTKVGPKTCCLNTNGGIWQRAQSQCRSLHL